MKTTVEIADSLFKDAKSVAEKSGVSLRQLIEDGLRNVLDRRQQKHPRFTLRDGSFQGNQLRAELSWPEIRRAVYKGRGE